LASNREDDGGVMIKNAEFSKCRQYRYSLWREWDDSLGYLMVVGLNPSTADESTDDPTIRRCIGFAKQWGYGALCMVNLFAIRATDPKVMLKHPDPVGADNDMYIRNLSHNADLVLVAWGAHGTHMNRGAKVNSMIHQNTFCLGVTKTGQPKHPLYIKADFEPILYLNNQPEEVQSEALLHD
jgi:hypothetical protein